MKGEMEIIGYKRSEFTPNDGQPIKGYQLHVTEDREDVEGLAADRVFVTDKRLNGYVPQLGDVIRLIYNRWGKVDAVELVKL